MTIVNSNLTSDTKLDSVSKYNKTKNGFLPPFVSKSLGNWSIHKDCTVNSYARGGLSHNL